MNVVLLHNTPLWVCDTAIAKCWDTAPKTGDAMEKRIDRVGNKNKHGSVLEHLVYSFDIDGISRACLQELARHRMASLTVRSTRYTLNKIKPRDGEYESLRYADYLVQTGNVWIDTFNDAQLSMIVDFLASGVSSNDIAKYSIPEALKTSLVWTINARSLQNFLKLRTSKSALWEIRALAKEVYHRLPNDHKFLYKEIMDGEEEA